MSLEDLKQQQVTLEKQLSEIRKKVQYETEQKKITEQKAEQDKQFQLEVLIEDLIKQLPDPSRYRDSGYKAAYEQSQRELLAIHNRESFDYCASGKCGGHGECASCTAI